MTSSCHNTLVTGTIYLQTYVSWHSSNKKSIVDNICLDGLHSFSFWRPRGSLEAQASPLCVVNSAAFNGWKHFPLRWSRRNYKWWILAFFLWKHLKFATNLCYFLTLNTVSYIVSTALYQISDRHVSNLMKTQSTHSYTHHTQKTEPCHQANFVFAVDSRDCLYPNHGCS